ncbi:hypothetical protein M436DRAFT_63252 [Aureobasidium namibiae CBS 147.97]|uniref:Uncharacterized protein n=1 Tax=Aureobasidium namibiae CBS 147.97 TaxID=1043004 RepID=A0A074WLA2_9PEZI
MQTPPRTPASPQEGRSGGPKRRRRNSTSSDADEDGAVFLGRRRRSISPEPVSEEIQPERRPRGQRSPRRYSNVSEDGAVFMGRDISRPNTPQSFRRCTLSINVPASRGHPPPRSPMGRLVYWLERPLNYASWTVAQQQKFWKEVALALTIVVSFLLVTRFSQPDCPPRYTAVSGSDGGAAVSVPTHHHHYSSTSSVQSPTIVPGESVIPSSPAVIPSSPIGPLSPISPNSPAFPGPHVSNPGSIPNPDLTAPRGVLASELWTYNPKTVAYAFSGYIIGNLGNLIHSAFWGQVGSKVVNKGYEAFAAEPDVHGWDTAIASQQNRAGILEALRGVEESADASDSLKRIETLEALQTQLDELKVHQYEIVKNLDLYHRASILASSALDDHTLFGSTKPDALKSLNTLRVSMLETASALLNHIDSADQNTAFVKNLSEGLPWKMQRRSSRWRKLLNGWRSRGVRNAFTRLEHFEVYVNAVRGMVTSDVLALR